MNVRCRKGDPEAQRCMHDAVWLGASTLTYPKGGGHFWAYLNWALGLQQAGCEVVWLEHVDPDLSPAELDRLLCSLKEKLSPYGLADSVALCPRGTHPLPEHLTDGLVPLAAADYASLFLNMGYDCSRALLKRFERTALLDIDPGLLQIWMSEGVVDVPAHDCYFSIGENVGRADALFPSVVPEWIYTPPAVALEYWPVLPTPTDAAFTTVAHWSAAEWVSFRGEVFPNDKRTAFLPYLDLPKQTSVPMELALCLAADDELELRAHEAEESMCLTSQGWRIVHSHAVSSTPSDYQSYIQRSRGEFSCAKPAFVRFQTGWVSDRTICFLASGRPAIVQHTGPSRFLPEADGLFRFRNPAEAIVALETVASDYEHHARQARRLAEEHFSAAKVVPRLLDRALDKKSARRFSGAALKKAGAVARRELMTEAA